MRAQGPTTPTEPPACLMSLMGLFQDHGGYKKKKKKNALIWSYVLTEMVVGSRTFAYLLVLKVHFECEKICVRITCWTLLKIDFPCFFWICASYSLWTIFLTHRYIRASSILARSLGLNDGGSSVNPTCLRPGIHPIHSCPFMHVRHLTYTLED